MKRSHLNNRIVFIRTICRLFCFILFFSPHQILFSQDTISRNYEFILGSLPDNENGGISCYHLSNLMFDEVNGWIEHSGNNTFLMRTSNVIFAQLFVGKEFYGVFPHEFFGHFMRGKEFGMDVRRIHLRFPGVGGYTTANITHQVPVVNRLIYAASGSEVQSVIAFQAEKDLYTGGEVPTYTADVIFINKLFQYLYYREDLSTFARDPEEFIRMKLQGGDYSMFTLTLAERYGFYNGIVHQDSSWFNFPVDSKILNISFVKDQNQKIRNAFLLSFLDFGMLEFLIGNYQYIANGRSSYTPFMFSIENVKFIPSIRANLGEVGVENYFDMIVAYPKLPQLNVYYRRGGNSIDKVNGAGFALRDINISNQLRISPQFDLWHVDRNNRTEFNINSDLSEYMFDSFYLRQSIGYKSYGSLIGKPFHEGMYAYLGFGFKVNRIFSEKD